MACEQPGQPETFGTAVRYTATLGWRDGSRWARTLWSNSTLWQRWAAGAALVILFGGIVLHQAVTPPTLVGHWQEISINGSTTSQPDDLTFFKDGTFDDSKGTAGQYRVMDGSHLMMTVWGLSQVARYTLGANTLTLVGPSGLTGSSETDLFRRTS